MTWIYVPPTCLPSQSVRGLEASMSASEWPCRGQKPSVTWRGKRMRRRHWFAAWRKESWIRLLSGTILKPSTAERGAARWIASLADTPASPSASPERWREKKTHGTSGRTSGESSKRPAPASVFSKTCPVIYVWASRKSMTTFKDWVLELRQACSRRRRLVRRMAANASLSSQWKTPASSDYKGSSRAGQWVGQLSEQAERKWPYWQTPTLTSGKNRGNERKNELMLPGQVHEWPTPDASLVTDTEDPESWLKRMNARRLEDRVKYGTPLGVASRIWPTLVVQSRLVSRSGLGFFLRFLQTTQNGRTYFTVPRNLRRLYPGDTRNAALRLNPNFAEWLMGWPPGWTDYGPLATAFARYRRRMLSAYSHIVSCYEMAWRAEAKKTLVGRRMF